MRSLDKVKNKKNDNVIDSFNVGFKGLFNTIKKERNIKIGLFITLFLIIASVFLKLTNIEWIMVILTSALVLVLEFINTALEYTVDMAMPTIHPLAKLSKDTMAGAVVFMVVISFVIGLFIYIPKIISIF